MTGLTIQTNTDQAPIFTVAVSTMLVTRLTDQIHTNQIPVLTEAVPIYAGGQTNQTPVFTGVGSTYVCAQTDWPDLHWPGYIISLSL